MWKVFPAMVEYKDYRKVSTQVLGRDKALKIHRNLRGLGWRT